MSSLGLTVLWPRPLRHDCYGHTKGSLTLVQAILVSFGSYWVQQIMDVEVVQAVVY